MRTLKEEHVDYSDYEDFDDTQSQLHYWLEVTYISGLIPYRKTTALQFISDLSRFGGTMFDTEFLLG